MATDKISGISETRIFDKRDRLTEQIGRTYHYDGNNNRLRIDVNGQTVYHIYDGAKLVHADQFPAATIVVVHPTGIEHV